MVIHGIPSGLVDDPKKRKGQFFSQDLAKERAGIIFAMLNPLRDHFSRVKKQK
jgi:hypothetical protein